MDVSIASYMHVSVDVCFFDGLPHISLITEIRPSIKMSANFALLGLMKDALGRAWPHVLLKHVFISASKAKLADIFMPAEFL